MTAPTITTSGNSPIYEEDDTSPTQLDGGVSVFDQEFSDAGSYLHGFLLLERAGGANPEDVFEAMPGSGLTGLTEGGGAVYDGVVVAAVHQNSGGRLELGFSADATQSRVDGLLRAIGYRNTSQAPPWTPTIEWKFSDGSDIATASTVVKVQPERDEYLWSTLPDGTHLVLDPRIDALRVDGGISAAQMTLSEGSVVLSYGGKTITLEIPFLSIVSKHGFVESSAPAGNIVFDDNSKIVVGDDWWETQNDDLGNMVFGSSGNDLMLGLGGGDTLVGGDDADILDGGDGIDFSSFGSSIYDTVASLANSAINTGWAAGDRYVSIEGLIGSDFNDTLFGDAGANDLRGAPGNDTLYGLGGDDVLWASDVTRAGRPIDRNLLVGGDGADTLHGDLSDDTLAGGDGDDSFGLGPGLDLVTGDAGADTAVFSSFNAAVWVDLSNGPMEGWTTDQASRTSGTNREMADLAGVENVIGGQYDDYLGGDGVANRLEGGAGGDLIEGRGGDDTLVVGGTGADTADGGDGFDTADFSQFGATLWVDLSNTPMEAQTTDQVDVRPGWATRQLADLVNVENIVGGAYDDYLGGNSLSNVLDGGGGDDLVDGRGGDDILRLGPGTDSADGGEGIDTADFSRFGAAVWVDLTYTPMEGWTTDQASRVEGTSRAMADLSNVENLRGTAFGDFLGGNHLGNVIAGGAGDDLLYGGGGADVFAIDSLDGIDTVGDFRSGEGDVVDVRSVLSGYGASSNINDFVHLFKPIDNSTYVAVNADGIGGDFTNVAILQGVTTWTTAHEMAQQGYLLPRLRAPAL